MKVAIIIPARLESKRFPLKMLQRLDGVPLIKRVFDKASTFGYDMFVATDSVEIASVIPTENVVMTGPATNGTERVARAADLLQEYDYYINVQGDQPDITAEAIEAIIKSFKTGADVATVCFESNDYNFITNKGAVKVIFSGNFVHWFTRYGMPYGYHHIGLYGYTADALATYLTLEPGEYENYEELEQLRWLEHGFEMGIEVVDDYNGFEINTPEDLVEWTKRNAESE